MGMVFGNGVLQRFTNAKTGKGYWDTGELPDVDLMGKPVFVVFDMDAYYQSQEATGDDGNSKPPKKYMIPVTGLIAGGIDEWNNYSWSVYTDIDGLKEQLKKAFKKGTVILGQPIEQKGQTIKLYCIQQRRDFCR